ncbi:MAG: contractile injection system tape measure protein [Bacteroidota bacterium]|nr:contractile injection system tape measure protein [Bacteroidota bacterium]
MGMQNRIAEVFYENLQPRIEVLFDELFGKNYYASIDKLEIDCGLLNKKNWEQEFTEQAIRKMKEQLVQANKKAVDFKKIEETSAAETFLFFLKNGYLPWNKRIDSIAELEQLISIDEQLVLQLKKLITQQAKVAERLAYQFSKKFTAKIIAAITKGKKKKLDEISSLLEKLSSFQIDKHIIEAAILNAFATDEKETIVDDLIKKNDKIEKENKNKIEAIYIVNAGLVLLHPFLQTLFEHLKLTKENIWLDEASQHKAVLVLAFLATGNDAFEEFNLMLNKILCGVAIDEVVVTEQQLSEEIKNECDALLNNVITHWSVLKNTSIEGLREAFLQRNGKLSKVDNGWLLQVEQKAIDVLLGHLPWGIGFVKLPCMNEMLFTEWA